MVEHRKVLTTTFNNQHSDHNDHDGHPHRHHCCHHHHHLQVTTTTTTSMHPDISTTTTSHHHITNNHATNHLSTSPLTTKMAMAAMTVTCGHVLMHPPSPLPPFHLSPPPWHVPNHPDTSDHHWNGGSSSSSSMGLRCDASRAPSNFYFISIFYFTNDFILQKWHITVGPLPTTAPYNSMKGPEQWIIHRSGPRCMFFCFVLLFIDLHFVF